MDQDNITTRKGFLSKAGLALAGIFALNKGVQGETVRHKETASTAMHRVRKAKGAVERNV